MVPWAGLQGVIVVFPDYTHILFKLLITLTLSSHVYENGDEASLSIISNGRGIFVKYSKLLKPKVHLIKFSVDIHFNIV